MKAIDYSSIIPYVFTMWPVGSHGVLMVASLLNDGAAKSSDGAPGASRATYANRQRHKKKTKRERIVFWGFFLVPWRGHRTPWELFGSFFVQNMCRQKPSIGPEAPRGLMATPPAPPKTMVNFSGGENSTSEEKRA